MSDPLPTTNREAVACSELLAAKWTPAVKWVLLRALKMSRSRHDDCVRLEDLMVAFKEFPAVPLAQIERELEAANE